MLVGVLLLAGSSCKQQQPAPARWDAASLTNNSSAIEGNNTIHFATAQEGWISNGRDQNGLGAPVLLHTTSGGQSWTSIDLSALRISRFLDFYPITNQLLYACAPDVSSTQPNVPRELYMSRDGGTTWRKVPGTGLNGSAALHFFSEQVGISVDVDVIQKTTDGGTTWRTVDARGLTGLTQLVFPTPQTGYAAGGIVQDQTNTGILLKTTDQGETWQPLPWSYGAITTLTFLTNTLGLATSGSYLYKTQNGGLSWQLVSNRLPLGSASCFLTEQEAYIAGQDISHSTDGGQSWQVEYSLPSNTGERFTAIQFSSAGTGVAVTNSGRLLKSNN